MTTQRSQLLGVACLLALAAGCAPKGNMSHVKVETTQFAAEKGLTVKDWSWSGGTFSVKLATSGSWSGNWILYAQTFDAKGDPQGPEAHFLNFAMKPNQTEWVEVPDLKLTPETARVAFDLQNSLTSRREPHY
jgi:hypothetical protein